MDRRTLTKLETLTKIEKRTFERVRAREYYKDSNKAGEKTIT